MPTRATEAEVFVSSLRTQDEVDALCKKYGVPKEFTARPAGDLRANSTPPSGAICVYARAMKAGMRFPLLGFFREVFAHFGIAPAQLTPNGWRAMAGFLALCHSAGVPPSLPVFRCFFVLCALCHEHKKGWYFFRPRRERDSSGLLFRGLLKPASRSVKDWKHKFFFLSSPEQWPCAVEWREPSNGSSSIPVLTGEENKSVLKLLSAHGGAAVDLRSLLPATCSGRRSRLCNSNLAAASPPPPPSSTRITSCSKGMDPSVYDMMKTMLAEKAAAQASASAKKRTWEEANGGEEVPPLSVLSNVRSPPPQHFPSRHDGDATDWEAARDLLEGAVQPPLERSFAPNEPSDDAAILKAATYVLQLEEKLVEAKNELAAAKRAADAERENAKSELAAAGAELEKTKAELAAAKRASDADVVKTKAELAAAKEAAEAEAVKTKAELAAALEEAVKTKAEVAAAVAEAVKTKAELAAAVAEVVKMKAELAAAEAEAVKTKVELASAKRAETEVAKANAELAEANRAVEEELVKAKAKLAAVEAELVSAKSSAAVHELLASEENVRRRAELALQGYQRWRGRHAPAGRAA